MLTWSFEPPGGAPLRSLHLDDDGTVTAVISRHRAEPGGESSVGWWRGQLEDRALLEELRAIAAQPFPDRAFHARPPAAGSWNVRSENGTMDLAADPEPEDDPAEVLRDRLYGLVAALDTSASKPTCVLWFSASVQEYDGTPYPVLGLRSDGDVQADLVVDPAVPDETAAFVTPETKTLGYVAAEMWLPPGTEASGMLDRPVLDDALVVTGTLTMHERDESVAFLVEIPWR